MAIRIVGIVLMLVSFELCIGMEVKKYGREVQICVAPAKHPYFDVDIIIGKSWRIYYTWNVDMEDICLDTVVKNATRTVVNRFYDDMHEYLQVEPEWAAATLYMKMGGSKQELLLFVDQGPAGSFLAVPNVIKNDLIPNRKAVPLLKFFIKLIQNKYLLMLDCHSGVASLSSRDQSPSRSEIDSIAAALHLGRGLHACLVDHGMPSIIKF